MGLSFDKLSGVGYWTKTKKTKLYKYFVGYAEFCSLLSRSSKQGIMGDKIS